MLLAVDTSTRWVGLALYDGAQVISEMIWQSQNHHTVEVAPAIDGILSRSGVQRLQLEALAVALGPGSFTSLRIGLGLVKGMALALHIPVIGIPTLDFLAYSQQPMDIPMAAVLQAGRGRLGVAWYTFTENGNWTAQGEPEVLHADELSQKIRKPTLVLGELSQDERQLLARKRKNVILASAAQSLRRPGYLAEMAWNRWQGGFQDDPITLSPYYLHVAEPIPG